MSIVLIEYDTKEKTMDVKMDGKAVKDVYCVHVYGQTEYNEPYIMIEKVLNNEEEKWTERTSIYASHTEVLAEPILDYDKLSEKLALSMKVEKI